MESEYVYVFQEGPYWDWRIAVDLFLGGTGVGAVLFAVVADEVYRGRYRHICATGAWLSPILVVLGLAFLISKLGHPTRLLLVYTNFNPSAPLWWGGLFQPLLVVLGFAYAWKWVHARAEDTVRRWLGRVTVVIAVVVGAYHGLLLAMINARPLWNTGPTVVSAILAFIATGIAAVAIAHLLRMRFTGKSLDSMDEASGEAYLEALARVRSALLAVLLMQLGTCFLWFLALLYGTQEDQQALWIANQQYAFMFWGLGIGLGLALPIAILGWTALSRRPWSQSSSVPWIALTSTVILVGGYFFRLSVLLSGQIPQPLDHIF